MEDLNKYRGNSHASRDEPAPKARRPIEAAISNPPTVRPRSPWSKMRVLFIGSDPADVGQHLLRDVIVPSIKDLLFDMVTEGASLSLYSDSRRPVGRGRNSGGTQYHRPVVNDRRSREPERPRELDRRERATHDFSNFTFRNAGQAEVIADTLYDRLAEYGTVTVADFYNAMGMTPEFTDENYGWTDLRGTKVTKVRDGYVLMLPRTEQLD